MHSTNYRNTFIAVADDCPVSAAQVPPMKGDAKTLAGLQFDTIVPAPYQFTSDDLIFGIHADKAAIPAGEREAERERFFSKGQPCLRSSPLAKRYGWGFHHDDAGKVAIYAMDSDEYKALAADPTLKHVRAMRSKRA